MNDIDEVLRRFTVSSTLRALCITGEWGTGKTYAVKNYYKDKNALPQNWKFSYASLFGITSLAHLRSQVCASAAGDANASWADVLKNLVNVISMLQALSRVSSKKFELMLLAYDGGKVLEKIDQLVTASHFITGPEKSALDRLLRGTVQRISKASGVNRLRLRSVLARLPAPPRRDKKVAAK